MNRPISPPPIPFIDLAAQRRRLGPAIDDAVSRVLDHCQFIIGPEVGAFESELAAYCGVAPAAISSPAIDGPTDHPPSTRRTCPVI